MFMTIDNKQIRRKNKTLFLMLGVALICFSVWLIFSILTTKSELELLSTYTFPEFTTIEGLGQLDYGSYAVAVNGEIVTGKNFESVQPTASTAKMILGLAIMQAKPFALGENGETITIDEQFYQIYIDYAANGGSVSSVAVGEEISEHDALMSVFLPSSNNMADTLAIWAFGSLDKYRDYATKMLADLGINDTTIGIDASGFDASTTSTAADLAKIGTKVMGDPVLKEIVATTEYAVPVAGTLVNTNGLLGVNRISGIKTGFIGEQSGYCLISGYLEDDNIVTLALLGAPTRKESFDDSLAIINQAQEKIMPMKIISAGEVVGHYNSWWTGEIEILADEDLYALCWSGAEKMIDLLMSGETGTLEVQIGSKKYIVPVSTRPYSPEPSIIEKIRHAFGWRKNDEQFKTDAYK